MIIYKITNLINNRVYIGQTIGTLDKRFQRHCLKSSNSFISKAIRKYGKHNFLVEKLETCISRNHLDDREIYWISYYNSTDRNLGYNRTVGGQNGGLAGEALEKMKIGVSRALRGKRKPKKTKEHVEAHRKSILGKPNIKKRKKIKCSNGKYYDSILSASIDLKLSKGNICSVLKGYRNLTGGYYFEYI